jgi:hypothetical protein
MKKQGNLMSQKFITSVTEMIEMSGKEFKVVLKLSMTSKKIKICR